MAMDRNDELGGLWLRESAQGNKFMSGKLTVEGQEVEVVVFKNSHKQPGERTPDYRMYRSRPREETPRSSGPQMQNNRDRGQIDYAADLDDTIPF